MTEAVTSIRIVHRGQDPTTLARRLVQPGNAAHALGELSQLFGGIQSGAEPARVDVRVDGSAGVSATATITVDISDALATNTLTIDVPGIGSWAFIGDDAAAGPEEFTTDVTDDTVSAAEIAALINGREGLRDYVSATSALGVVTLKAIQPGTWGNGIKIVTKAAAGAFTVVGFAGGAAPGSAPTATITCGAANPTANDTIVIGSVTLTAKAAAVTENDFVLNTTPATHATNLAAAINAHSKLSKLVVATRASAVITLTWTGEPRAGELVALSRTEVNTGSIVLSGAALASASTESAESDAITYPRGGSR